MYNLCMVRVINALTEEEAKEIVGRCCEEFSSDYRTADYGIEVVREINACEFLSIYENKSISNDQVEDWMNSNGLDTIYENFTEDNLDDETLKKIEDLWGPEFSSCVFIDKINPVINDNNEWIFQIYFDICPTTCLWDNANIVNLKEEDFNDVIFKNIEYGRTKEISEKCKNDNRSYMNLVLDATKEKDEYGRLMPICTMCSSSNKNKLLCINDTFNQYPESDNDYVYYLVYRS